MRHVYIAEEREIWETSIYEKVSPVPGECLPGGAHRGTSQAFDETGDFVIVDGCDCDNAPDTSDDVIDGLVAEIGDELKF